MVDAIATVVLDARKALGDRAPRAAILVFWDGDRVGMVSRCSLDEMHQAGTALASTAYRSVSQGMDPLACPKPEASA